MKVVHIIPTLTFGGAERFVVDLANHSDYQHDIIIFKPEQPLAQQLREDIEVYEVKKRGKLSLGLFNKLKSKLKEINPDIVHTHLFGGDFWGRAAARQLGLPVVTTEHNLNKSESWFKKTIKQGLRSYTNIYTAPSKAVSNYMQQVYKIDKENIEVIPHGIVLDKFLNTQPYIHHQPLKLLILGRLDHQKGIDIAIEALKDIDKSKWHLNIVGQGEKFSDLKKLIEQYDLSDNIELWDPTADIVEEYNTHDVILVPSRWEGLGIVAMEAMASGRVVIASEVDGLKEFIDHNSTGFLFEAENVSKLKQRIRFCLSYKKMCTKVAERARKYAKNNFSIDKMVEKYDELYSSLFDK